MSPAEGGGGGGGGGSGGGGESGAGEGEQGISKGLVGGQTTGESCGTL